jgi:diguanylate cyclase (GGDEF)-like protein
MQPRRLIALTDAFDTQEINRDVIREDCVRLLFSCALPANITVLAVSILLMALLVYSSGSIWPLAWFSLMLVAIGIRLSIWQRYKHCETVLEPAQWSTRYAFATLLVGIAWACALLLMIKLYNQFELSMVYLVLFAVMAGTVPLLSAVPLTFTAYTLPPTVTIMGSCLYSGEHYSLLISLTGGLCFLFISMASRNAHIRIIESLILQHQNERLIERLSVEIDHRNNVQRELEQHQLQLEQTIQQRTMQLSETNRDLEFEITERKRIVDNLKHLVHHDALTNLPNRLLLDARLKHALERAHRNSLKVAVLFLDLDNFKHINDSLGHEVGDILLRHVASQLQSCVREDDTVSRLGGDEFVIIIEQVHNIAHVHQLAEKLSLVVAEKFDAKGHMISVSASIGISLFPDNGNIPEALIKCADDAMYRAKSNGRHNYQFYTSELTESAYDRVMLANSLRQAIEQHQLGVYYQPQFNIADKYMTGAEALVRWQHDELGLLTPGDFLRTAEDAGLMFDMGEFVLRSACRQIRQWRDEGLDISIVAANLSNSQVRHPDLITLVRNILDETGCEPGWLELEITEEFIMKETEQCIETIAGLHSLGLSLAINDFGAGYSSLSYLRRLPINKLKIDRSFIADISRDMDSAAIVQAMIAMGHSLNMEIIANGVENSSQEIFLNAHHCETAQGYHYAHPMTADDITEKLRSQLTRNVIPQLVGTID